MNDANGSPDYKVEMSRLVAEQYTRNVKLNVGSDVILAISENKVENCLLKYEKDLGKAGGWKTPLAILIMLTLALVTTDFTDFGFRSSTWEAFFMMGVAISAIWLVISIKGARGSKKKIEQIVNELTPEVSKDPNTKRTKSSN